MYLNATSWSALKAKPMKINTEGRADAAADLGRALLPRQRVDDRIEHTHEAQADEDQEKAVQLLDGF